MADYKKIEKRCEVKQAKVYRGLADEFSKIAQIRFINGLDKRPSPPIVEKKMLKHPLWEKIKEDLKIANFIDDKKGQTEFNIFYFMIVAFMAVVIFGGLIYVMGIINGAFHQVGMINEVNAGKPGYTNMTQISDSIFGQVNQSIQALRMVALVYILGLAVCIMVTNALQKKHPIFFFAYILIGLMAVIFSPPISNSYETLLNSGIYDNGLQGFTGPNFIILNLPTVVLVIFIFGGIFLFINLIRTPGETL